ncbi:hypothetical protein GCM10025767_11360 [Thalassotalea piscium]|uniref:Putative membrane protein n=1 Tax=Thalassotalea piscium TaxID=1230533 RepID=A0A7X0NKJ5_9GAMM|nr:putative membrane protein [Thalassotalea piscium]
MNTLLGTIFLLVAFFIQAKFSYTLGSGIFILISLVFFFSSKKKKNHSTANSEVFDSDSGSSGGE